MEQLASQPTIQASAPCEVIVRETVSQDAADLARLLGQLGYPCTTEDAQQRLAAIQSEADHVVAVACLEGRAMGWIDVRLTQVMSDGRFAEIIGLVVDELARRRGVGAHLIQWASSWASARGQQRMRVRTNVHREAAAAFYRDQGFREIKQHRLFELVLAPS